MSKGNKASLGCLFWIALFLLAGVLFLLNQDAITQVIQRFQAGNGKNPAGPQVVMNPPETSPPPRQPEASAPPVNNPSPSPSPKPEHEAVEQDTAAPSPTPSPAARQKSQYLSTLYFVTRGANESVALKKVTRQITHEDAPLLKTLQVLLSGPTTDERNSSLSSLIPQKSRIKNVYIKGDTAFIDFNDEFRYNDFGVPGLEAQVKQVVYTATEFPNVAQVQILINGNVVKYLAQEGVFIGSPLSRRSF